MALRLSDSRVSSNIYYSIYIIYIIYIIDIYVFVSFIALFICQAFLSPSLDDIDVSLSLSFSPCC